jgi:hypothetical protein
MNDLKFAFRQLAKQVRSAIKVLLPTITEIKYFSLARVGTREQQAGDVDAGNQQEKRDRAEQDQQLETDAASQVVE